MRIILQEDTVGGPAEVRKTASPSSKGPLMSAMNIVAIYSDRGGCSCRRCQERACDEKALAYLQPYLEAEKQPARTFVKGRIVMATVKGDVHDIARTSSAWCLGATIMTRD